MDIIKQQSIQNPPTLCWDCANATGMCDWSKSLTPVDGWTAKYVQDKDSYKVIDCPMFERDAIGCGAKRLHNEKETKKSNGR